MHHIHYKFFEEWGRWLGQKPNRQDVYANMNIKHAPAKQFKLYEF